MMKVSRGRVFSGHQSASIWGLGVNCLGFLSLNPKPSVVLGRGEKCGLGHLTLHPSMALGRIPGVQRYPLRGDRHHHPDKLPLEPKDLQSTMVKSADGWSRWFIVKA